MCQESGIPLLKSCPGLWYMVGIPGSLRKLIVASILVLAVAFGGWWLGSAFGRHKTALSRVQQSKEWSQRLAQSLVGIGVGGPFPSFPVWAADSLGLAKDVRDLLPNGGLIASVSPSCNVCVEVALALVSAKQMSQASDCEIVLILQGDTYEALTEALREEQVTLPIYRDIEQRLIREHGVNVNPTIFLIDSSGIVRHIGAGPHSDVELSGIIEQHMGSRTQHLPKEGR